MDKVIKRESGIEALKIISIFLIVISHVTYNLSIKNTVIPLNNCMNIDCSSNNINMLILTFFRYLGAIGNIIFIWSSSWFLLSSKKVKINKIINILITNFTIYFIFLVLFTLLGVNIPFKSKLKCLLPTFFQLNWFVTAYLIFYFIHPYLNILIDNIKREEHFKICLIGFVICSIIPLIVKGHLYVTNLVEFCYVYFIVGYIQKYKIDIIKFKKMNLITVFLGIFLLLIQIIILNILGNKMLLFKNKMFHFIFNVNPSNLLISYGLFNIFYNFKFKSKLINYLSSLSLLIYIFHENYLVRSIIRPYIWNWIYSNFTYSFIVIKTIIFSIGLFILSIFFSILFKETIGKIITLITNKVQKITSKIYYLIIKKIY